MMLRLLARFLRIHCTCFFGSFSKRGRRVAPLGPRRLFFLFFLFPAGLVLQLVHWIGFLLDDLLFLRHRREPLERPLFITGLPRSGTTFVHRLLAEDRRTFSTFATWEVILAPSATEKVILRGLAGLDNLAGAPLRRLVRSSCRRFGGEFGEIHEVGPEAPEEDYLCLLPAAGCFLLALAFPSQKEFWQLADFSSLSDSLRRDLLQYYRRCLQAHQLVRAKGRPILSKNAAFASWVPALHNEFPDAAFLLCIRDPKKGLASQLSSIAPARTLFGADPDGLLAASEFPEVFTRGYQALSGQFRKEATTPASFAVVDQEDLRENAGTCLREALRHLEIPVGSESERTLARESRRGTPHQSRHRYRAGDFPVDMDAFLAEVRQSYEHLRAHRVRAKP